MAAREAEEEEEAVAFSWRTVEAAEPAFRLLLCVVLPAAAVVVVVVVMVVVVLELPA